MTDRRHFLATTATSMAALSLGTGARADESPTASDGTWLTYAVNVEMTWGNLPFLDRLRKVKEAGFSHYEFWPWRGKDLDAIKTLNDELGLHVAQFSAAPRGFARGFADPARRDEFLEDIRLAVDVAKKLNVQKTCVVAGEEHEGLTKEQMTQSVIDCLKTAAPIVESAGITLILEPLNVLVDHPRQHVVTSEHAARILKAVGSPNVKMLFDCYHQQISEGNLSGNIRKYKDLIGYYQIADHPGRNQPGTGEVNYSHVFRVIHDVGYRGAIGLEMSASGDPMDAFKAVRKCDAEARDRRIGFKGR
ncbi:MAG: Hydroxypyruvate isomerase [Planctomycetota bacterium]|nr:Hydroxypyruvate isomerase [Planctomycetota bacterium]